MRFSSLQFIIALLLGAATLAGYLGWYIAVSNKSGETASLENRITAASASISRMSSVKSALAEVSGDEAMIQDYFVPEAGVVSFITTLEGFGSVEGSTVSVLSVSTGTLPGQPTLVLALSIQGSFNAVMRTVGAIEYAPYDLSISTLSINHDDKNVWHADLTLVVGAAPTAAATSTPTKKP